MDLEDVRRRLDEQTACVVFQSPNFLGVVEETRAIAAAAHARQAYAVQLVDEAMSLAFLRSPGSNGVDIAAGEAQSFGLPLAFGGPYLGFLAARSDFLRQMPGRIVGQTRDAEGRRGYVLTLSTREQHIKREKATSNICTNQAWCAVRAGMYLATMGQSGLEQVARNNHLNAAYFLRKISRCPQVRVKYRRDFYNEVVLETGRRKAESFLDKLKRQGILAGIPLRWFYPDWPNAVLITFTELHRPEEHRPAGAAPSENSNETAARSHF